MVYQGECNSPLQLSIRIISSSISNKLLLTAEWTLKSNFLVRGFRFFTCDTTKIAHVRALIIHRISIQNFFISACNIYPNTVIMARHRVKLLTTIIRSPFELRRSKANTEFAASSTTSQSKPCGELSSSRAVDFLINLIEVFNQLQYAFVPASANIFIKQEPVQTFFVIPLTTLGKFIPHKEQFLPG